MPPSDDRRDSPALRQEGPQQAQSMTDAAEMLWVVLANVSGGDWTKQSADWQEAAARWRDNYFAALSTSRTAQAPQQEGLDLAPIKSSIEEHSTSTILALIAEIERHRARIQVLETSVDYLRYLVDHPVTQEQK